MDEALTATLSDPDGSISSTDWQWQGRAPGSTTWRTLSGTTAGRSQVPPSPEPPERSSFTPGSDRVGWVLRAVVNHYVDGHGAGKRAVSGETVPVLANGPTAPRDFKGSPGDRRVTLSWNAPESNRGATITGYAYRYTRDENTSDETSWTAGTLGVTTRHLITGLDNGTPYTFELWALNPAATGDAAPAQATPGGPFTLAAAGRDEYVSLSWTPAPVSGPPVRYYSYRRSNDGGSTWTRWSSMWARLPGYPADPLYYVVQSLTNGIEYTFELRAFNANGQVGEASATATPTATPGDEIQLLRVSYGADSYRATEGDSVAVEVRLSPAADRAVDIPITVTADEGTESGDYRVSGLSPGDTLPFAENSASETFHIVALPDPDADDETVTLGFGAKPPGVLAGTTSSTTVTLADTTGTSGPLTISGPASVCYDKDRTDAVARYEARDGQANPVSSASWIPSGVDAGAFGVTAGVLRFDPGPSFEDPTDDGADNVYNVSLRAEEGARRSDLFPVAVSVVNADDGVLTLSPDPPVVGRTLRATLADLDGGATNFRWEWTKSPASSGPRYSLVADSYTPEASDAGQTLTVTVTYDDRCSSGNTLSVTSQPVESPPADTPDLVVESATVTDNTPAAGGSFTLSATVRNQGSGSSVATTLRYYRSTDGTIATGDTEVGTDVVGALAASGTSAESIGLTAPAEEGTYYYGACVVAVSGEANTGNNCSSAVTVTVGDQPPPSSPDLVVGAPSVTDSSPPRGGSFTLSATVRNQGGGSSVATTLRYYRSTDGTIATSDTQVGRDEVSALAASATSAESIGLTAPSTEGTYYYGACVVAVTGETETGNNCSGAVTVTVVNSPPEITSGAGASVPEGTAGVVYTGTATDPDGDTVTWSKRDHDHADFNLDSSSGALSFGTAPDHEKPHDGDTNSKYKVTIVATDPAGAYDTQLVTITVTDVDGTPTVTGPASITKPEKSDRKVAAYTVSDPDPSETFDWSLEGPYAAAFFEHQAGSHVKERELHFQRTPDYETRSSYTVDVKATNSEGRSDQQTVTITLENVDDGGTVTVSPSTPVVGETVTATLIDVDGGVVIDPDDASHGWTWTHVDAPPGARYPSIRTETYTPTGDDVDYRLRVTVDYDDAQGPGKSAWAVTTNSVQAVLPGPPKGVGTARTGRSLTVSWSAAEANGSAIQRYEVNELEGITWLGWTSVGTSTSYTKQGVSDSRAYSFQVRAVNGIGAGPSVEVTSPPLGPGGNSARGDTAAAAKTLATLASPAGLAIFPAPNPFNPSTILYLRLPEEAPVSLIVYNVAGQPVAVLVDEPSLRGVVLLRLGRSRPRRPPRRLRPLPLPPHRRRPGASRQDGPHPVRAPAQGLRRSRPGTAGSPPGPR